MIKHYLKKPIVFLPLLFWSMIVLGVTLEFGLPSGLFIGGFIGMGGSICLVMSKL